MPPRRPPPLLPKARLLEAINAAPPNARTTPTNIYDSRIVLSEHISQNVPPHRLPWLSASSTGDGSEHGSRASTSAPSVAGYTCYTPNLPAGILHPSSSGGDIAKASYIHTSSVANTGRDGEAASAVNGEGGAAARAPAFLGRTVTMRELEDMPSILNPKSDSSSRQLFVVEPGLRQGSSHLASMTDLLQSKALAAFTSNNSEWTILVGNMGYPDLRATLEGKRSGMDMYERAVSEVALYPKVYWQFSGYLSLLPPEKVSAAFREHQLSPPSGGEAYKACKKAISAFFIPVLEAFGEDRIIWGSDWPQYVPVLADDIKSTGLDEWSFSFRLALDIARDIGLRGESLDKIFGANARALCGQEPE